MGCVLKLRQVYYQLCSHFARGLSKDRRGFHESVGHRVREIGAPDALQYGTGGGRIQQVSLDHFRTERAKAVRPVIRLVNKGSNWKTSLNQSLRDKAPCGTLGSTCGAGD